VPPDGVPDLPAAQQQRSFVTTKVYGSVTADTATTVARDSMA